MGRYIDQTYLESKFGATNIAEWSNRENDGTGAATSVITDAIAFAEQYVDDRFRGGPYQIPFSGNGTDSLIVVKKWCSNIAGAELYRGRPAGSKAQDRMATVLEGIENEMDFYLSGQRKMDAARVTPGVSGLTVITDATRVV